MEVCMLHLLCTCHYAFEVCSSCSLHKKQVQDIIDEANGLAVSLLQAGGPKPRAGDGDDD